MCRPDFGILGVAGHFSGERRRKNSPTILFLKIIGGAVQARIIHEAFVGRDAPRRFGVSRRGCACHAWRRDTWTTGIAPYNSSLGIRAVREWVALMRWTDWRRFLPVRRESIQRGVSHSEVCPTDSAGSIPPPVGRRRENLLHGLLTLSVPNARGEWADLEAAVEPRRRRRLRQRARQAHGRRRACAVVRSSRHSAYYPPLRRLGR